MKKRIFIISVAFCLLLLSSCSMELNSVKIKQSDSSVLIAGESMNPGYEIGFLSGDEHITLQYTERGINVISPGDLSESRKKKILKEFESYSCVWVSSDESVLTVSETGMIKAAGAGDAVIFFSCGDRDKKVFSTSMSYTVHRVVDSISAAKSLNLTVGSSSQLKVSVLPEDASDKKIEFVSADKKVAVVDKNGKVKAVGAGSTKITIKSLDSRSEAETSVSITVKAKPVVSDQASYETEILKLVNEARAAEGLSPLKIKKSLSSSAKVRAKEITEKLSHDRPNGKSWSTVDSDARAENLAMGYASAKDVVRAWMNSSGHRRNIMNPNYKTIGIGRAKGSNGAYYWVQLFGN